MWGPTNCSMPESVGTQPHFVAVGPVSLRGGQDGQKQALDPTAACVFASSNSLSQRIGMPAQYAEGHSGAGAVAGWCQPRLVQSAKRSVRTPNVTAHRIAFGFAAVRRVPGCVTVLPCKLCDAVQTRLDRSLPTPSLASPAGERGFGEFGKSLDSPRRSITQRPWPSVQPKSRLGGVDFVATAERFTG